MTTNEDAKTLIMRAITKGSESPKDVADRLGDGKVYPLMSAALSIAASRKFPAGTELVEISGYVSSLRDRFPDAGEVLKPTIAEAVIRAARGEADRLEGLSPDDVGPLLFLLTYAIMTEKDLSAVDADAFVDEVVSMAGVS